MNRQDTKTPKRQAKLAALLISPGGLAVECMPEVQSSTFRLVL